jgi:hypothetical protein
MSILVHNPQNKLKLTHNRTRKNKKSIPLTKRSQESYDPHERFSSPLYLIPIRLTSQQITAYDRKYGPILSDSEKMDEYMRENRTYL